MIEKKYQPMAGVEEWRNKSGYWIYKLHYSADPEKASEEWKSETKKGYTKKMWKQEMEIQSHAMAGNLIYTVSDVNRLRVSVEDLDPDWTLYHWMDSGISAPCAALWAVATPDGYVIVVAEYYERNRNVPENSAGFKLIEDKLLKHFNNPVYCRAADPKIFATCENTGRSIADDYADEGFHFIAGNNDVNMGVQTVRNYLSPVSMKRSRLIILDNLYWIFKEFERYRIGPNDKPIKKHDHLMDALKYGLVNNPVWIPPQSLIPDDQGFIKMKSPLGFTQFVRRMTEEEDEDGR